MTSKKQLEANRANSKKSSGPKSASGKARSSSNSWKHGLTAKRVLLPGEDAFEFDELCADLMEEWKPKGRTECILVERMVILFWRLYRVPEFEAAILAARQTEIAPPEQKPGDSRMEIIHRFQQEAARLNSPKSQRTVEFLRHLDERNELAELAAQVAPPKSDTGLALIRDSENSDALGNVLRYETAITNGLARTMSMLISLQNARKAREEASNEVTVVAHRI